ncbi:hypothetical protein Efla_001089 [Eimeria flavescens]
MRTNLHSHGLHLLGRQGLHNEQLFFFSCCARVLRMPPEYHLQRGNQVGSEGTEHIVKRTAEARRANDTSAAGPRYLGLGGGGGAASCSAKAAGRKGLSMPACPAAKAEAALAAAKRKQMQTGKRGKFIFFGYVKLGEWLGVAFAAKVAVTTAEPRLCQEKRHTDCFQCRFRLSGARLVRYVPGDHAGFLGQNSEVTLFLNCKEGRKFYPSVLVAVGSFAFLTRSAVSTPLVFF